VEEDAELAPALEDDLDSELDAVLLDEDSDLALLSPEDFVSAEAVVPAGIVLVADFESERESLR
jgi:hypothetical protein